ncbi:MAG: oligosaccharide flippase family protein, partial [Victivallales bacterium]|nr:oligosaccharide flippase family protein [Victivallales bacterium]
MIGKVIKLYCSTVAGVVLGIFVSVLNTRVLPPAQYGDVKYVTNIISFLAGFLLLGYFVSGCRLIAIERNQLEVRKLKGVLVIILAITAGVMMLAMGIFSGWNFFRGNSSMGGMFLIALPFCAAPLLLNYINTVSQGDNRINSIAFARLCPSGLYLVAAFIVYRIWGATQARMLAMLLGATVVIIVPMIILERPCFKNLRESFQQLNATNRKYGIHVYMGSICGVSLGYLAGITLGWFSSDNTDVGLFTLALALAGPLAMLPSIVGTVFFQRFAREERISRKVIVSTVLITVGSLLGYAILIHPVVSLLYHKSYAAVSGYAAWLAIGASLNGLGDMF